MHITDIALYLSSIIVCLAFGLTVGNYIGNKLVKSIEEHFDNKLP